jgi:flagellar hook-associated protein 3 FlgL
VQAANDTLSASDRAAIGLEIDGIRHDLQSLAATRDIDGSYLFSGTRMTTAPFQSSPAGGVSYAGDQVDTSIDIGEGRTLTLHLSGPAIFTGVSRNGPDGQHGRAGFFQVIDDLSAAVKASDATGMQRGLDELDALADGLTLATARIGSYQKQLDSQQSVLDATTLQLQSTLSSLRDSDYTEAITRLQQQTLSLQAAQGSFARTADLNLFNFLK